MVEHYSEHRLLIQWTSEFVWILQIKENGALKCGVFQTPSLSSYLSPWSDFFEKRLNERIERTHNSADAWNASMDLNDWNKNNGFN